LEKCTDLLVDVLWLVVYLYHWLAEEIIFQIVFIKLSNYQFHIHVISII